MNNYSGCPADDDSIEARMLDAVELFHYSYRFRGQRFSLILEDVSNLPAIIDDVRVLEVAHIGLMIVCPGVPSVSEYIGRWQRLGRKIRLFDSQEFAQVANESAAQTLPVVKLPPGEGFREKALELSAEHGALKAFLLGGEKGLFVDGKLYSFPSPAEIDTWLAGAERINIGKEQLAKLHELRKRLGLEIVLLAAERGSLFQEVFTHRGNGTLFSDGYTNLIRPGMLEDVEAISLLLRPYIRSGAIKPISDEEVASDIDNFFVYLIDNAIVAASRLKFYDDAAEMTKFCTLPRYQGRGRARKLAREMIEQARIRGMKLVFALSIEPKMWTFFERLGFSEVDRNELPAAWKQRYDFSRPSKAFQMMLGVSSTRG